MSATEELRKMLDERGVEWSANDGAFACETYWQDGGRKVYRASGKADGGDELTVHHLTPEQAIAATLGSGTCEMTPTFTTPINLDGSWQEWTCSECGGETYLDVMDEGERPRFCSNCGARAVVA